MAVSLICWALWLYRRQSDMLGFVAVWLICCWALCQSDMLGLVAVWLICWALYQSDVGLCGRIAVSLICWALCQSDFVVVWPSV